MHACMYVSMYVPVSLIDNGAVPGHRSKQATVLFILHYVLPSSDNHVELVGAPHAPAHIHAYMCAYSYLDVHV